MHYVYVLKSQKHGKLYVGYTNNLIQRVKDHNYGRSEFTKHGKPWKLIYYEAYWSEKDATKRERQLKNYGSAFGFLKRRIEESLNQS